MEIEIYEKTQEQSERDASFASHLRACESLSQKGHPINEQTHFNTGWDFGKGDFAYRELTEFAKWFYVAITEGEKGLEEYPPEDMEAEDYETVRYFLNLWRKNNGHA